MTKSIGRPGVPISVESRSLILDLVRIVACLGVVTFHWHDE